MKKAIGYIGIFSKGLLVARIGNEFTLRCEDVPMIDNLVGVLESCVKVQEGCYLAWDYKNMEVKNG
jgi:hypothetical protein